MVLATIRRRLFGIAPGETSFARRGFPSCAAPVREHLERVGESFVFGYHAALQDAAPDALAKRLAVCPVAHQGFAYEGAAMGLAILDRMTPWNRGRVRRFLDGPGGDHAYMVHVGVGWAMARLHRSVRRTIASLDPLLRWLAWDGYGFHETYFRGGGDEARGEDTAHRAVAHGDDTARGAVERIVGLRPEWLCGYEGCAFDQGVGRCLWFVGGAQPERIVSMIEEFPADRRNDLMSGVGLAATYAGGAAAGAVERLARMTTKYRAELALGSAFAAKARVRAEHIPAHTGEVCAILCGVSAEEAARITDDALVGLPIGEHAGGSGSANSYETWRGRIRAQFAREAVST